MEKSCLLGAVCTCLAVISFNANATIVSADWKTPGDGQITQDTGSGLEWLDLTATTNRSYNDISSKLGPGQEFDGWRYATGTEVGGFFDAFGGDSNYYYSLGQNSGWSTQNNGLFDLIAPFWGDTNCEATMCATGEGYSYAIIGESSSPGNQWLTFISDLYLDQRSADQDNVNIHDVALAQSVSRTTVGHALVRNISTVPLPSAVWLFGSGLLGLVGMVRRKNS